MNKVYFNEIDILKEKNFFKKKICWVPNCNKESMSASFNESIKDWIKESKNKNIFFINEGFSKFIFEVTNDKIWTFVCNEHEINWFYFILPKRIGKSEKQFHENIYKSYQSKFMRINISLNFFKWLHLINYRFHKRQYNIEKSCKEFFLSAEVPHDEKVWIEDDNYFYAIPIYIKKCTFKKYIGVTNQQGVSNGPDFIIQNSEEQTIGVELFQYQPIVFKNIKNIDKTKLLNLNKKIESKMLLNEEEKFELINLDIEKKLQKSKKWEETDFLLLTITMNHAIKGHEYYFFEFLLSLCYKNYLIAVDNILPVLII